MVTATAPISADAVVTQITSRSALGGDDVIDWALGPMASAVPNSFSVTSDGGLLAEVSKPAPQGNFLIWYQTTGAWQGNFAVDDAVLHSESELRPIPPGDPGPIVIDFSTPVAGAGAQIQSDTYEYFTGVVAAYDSDSGLLGEFSLEGEVLSDTGDNSAIFLGVLSDSADIARIEFSLEEEHPFGINQMDIVSTTAAPLAEVEVIWTSTTGEGTPGSSAIEAEPGDQLTAELWLTPADVNLVGYELSIEFDTDLADELDLVSATGIAPMGIPPIGGNPGSTQESSTSQRGNVLSFAAGPGQLPTDTLVIGEIVFVATENVLSDGLDVFSGVFTATDGVFVAPAGQDASHLVFFRGASVELSAADSDGDGIPDASDNCIESPNTSQLDTDGDDYGNACDCDFDQNLACSIADFSIFREDFLATVDRGVGTDMDGNGGVSIADFTLLRSGFVVGVPGPSGLVP